MRVCTRQPDLEDGHLAQPVALTKQGLGHPQHGEFAGAQGQRQQGEQHQGHQEPQRDEPGAAVQQQGTAANARADGAGGKRRSEGWIGLFMRQATLFDGQQGAEAAAAHHQDEHGGTDLRQDHPVGQLERLEQPRARMSAPSRKSTPNRAEKRT